MERMILSGDEGFSNPLKRILPERIVWLRKLRGLSQAQAAEKSGMSASGLCEIEGGLRDNLTVNALLRLADLYEVTPDMLLGQERNQDFVRGLYDQGVYRYYTVEELRSVPEECFYCGTRLSNRGIPHLLPDCWIAMGNRGASFQYIASRFGFSVEAVKVIMSEGMRLR